MMKLKRLTARGPSVAYKAKFRKFPFGRTAPLVCFLLLIFISLPCEQEGKRPPFVLHFFFVFENGVPGFAWP